MLRPTLQPLNKMSQHLRVLKDQICQSTSFIYIGLKNVSLLLMLFLRGIYCILVKKTVFKNLHKTDTVDSFSPAHRDTLTAKRWRKNKHFKQAHSALFCYLQELLLLLPLLVVLCHYSHLVLAIRLTLRGLGRLESQGLGLPPLLR